MEKSHKEKMMNGELYRGGDPELVAGQVHAQEEMQRLNAMPAGDNEARLGLLRGFFKELGEDAFVRSPFHCDYGYNISIGPRSFVNFGCVFLDCNEIRIGADVQIAPGVHIYTATHPLDPAIRKSGLESAHPVV
ncbi:MAG: sugar O-acetyltransferase, partial [Proteobacteria bacterium]